MARRKTNKIAAQKPPKPRSGLAWTRQGFHGHLLDDGRYVECRLPLLHPDPADPHRLCLARIRNTAHDLRNHFVREHNPGSAHVRDMAKDESRPWECAVGCSNKGSLNWAGHLAHIRSVHKFRGDSARIRKAGGVRKAGGTIDPETNMIVLPPEADEKEEDDKDEDVPAGPMFWEGHGDGGEGPSGGAAGGLIAAA
ncbi:hypothetical protein PG993_004136 [Apiospora rasikravindrae]|uniref:Uncharacterized protein n=1 Tax=Apiospora rasikravindrae TaxID=990691 RepID=A0ABR1TBY3_9PEZI